MLLRAYPVEYLPLIEDRVCKTSHLNASPAAQMALNIRIVFIQRLSGVMSVSESCGKGPINEILNLSVGSPTNF